MKKLIGVLLMSVPLFLILLIGYVDGGLLGVALMSMYLLASGVIAGSVVLGVWLFTGA